MLRNLYFGYWCSKNLSKNSIILSRSIIPAIVLVLLNYKVILEIHHEMSGITKVIYNFFNKLRFLNDMRYIFIHKNLQSLKGGSLLIKRLVADDVREQSRQVLEVIKQEGVAIIPLDVAYAIVGNSKKSIETIFECKKRSFDKPSGMFSNYELLKDIQVIASWKHDIIKAVIFDNDLPMSTVAPFKPDHPMFRNVDSWVLKNSTKIGTLDMLLNAGEFHNEMTKQSMELEMPVLGSSANTSLTGSKYNLDDIDPPVFGAADILIDGGTSKYKNEKGRSSTIIDFGNFETIRIGVCYDKIRAIFSKFGIDLVEDKD